MSLRDVLIDELRDMYSAENQLVVALPKLAKGAKSGELEGLFTSHLDETKGQVERLKKVFSILEEKPTGEHCNGMEGVIEEGADALEKDEEGPSFDSGIIGAALRTEHYEIAGYEAAIDMANTLGLSDVSNLLTGNLNEEVAAAKKIVRQLSRFSRMRKVKLMRKRLRRRARRNTQRRRAWKMRRRRRQG